MILSVSNVSKSFVDNDVLKKASFHIEDYDKAAIVGINGAGKSTLLKIIIGEINADEGLVTFGKDKTYGYLAQHQDINSTNTIFDELMSVKQYLLDLEQQIRTVEHDMKSLEGDELAKILEEYHRLTQKYESENGYAYHSEVVGIIKGLGFCEEEFTKKINSLSGGQKTRIALGKLLLQKPDLIILDEPTNHLDLNSISWLENYLLNYKGAVIIVSHDRYFLDKITNKIVEIDQGVVSSFNGNYSFYAQQKEHLRIEALHAYLNQQKEIKHQEEVIEKLKSFNREKSIKRAESREKMLDKIDRIEKPSEVNTDMKLTLIPRIQSGNDVMTVTNLSKAFGENKLFQNVNFEVKRGEHIAIIGDNGTGKTTLLKIINELIPMDEGEIKLGSNVEIGYYDQEHQVLHMEKTLFEEISDSYPDLNNTQIRNTLAAFLFTGESVFKKISSLSGGERGRVSLAKLMLSEANVLILDEPTNHLDIQSKEILETALNSYEGTVIYVSHDRYFINKTASRILELTQKQFINYIGNYDYYLSKKDILSPSVIEVKKEVNQSAQKVDWKQQKEQQALIRKKENELKKCEERISVLEEKISVLDEEMAKPEVAINSAKLNELSQNRNEYQTELDSLYEKWEELSEELS